MSYFLAHGATFVSLMTLIWVTGYLGERLFLRDQLPTLFVNLARWCVGLAFWTACVFLLCALGLFERGLVLTIAGLILSGAMLLALRNRTCLQPLPRPQRATVFFVIVFAALLAPFFLLAMHPALSWDADVYHLTLPKQLIADHSFRYIPFSVYSNWPMGVDLLFGLAMQVHDYILAKLLHFGFALLTVYALVVLARAHGSEIDGWTAAAAFIANDVVMFQLRVAYIDVAHAFYMTATFIFVDAALERREQQQGTSLFLLAGICSGLLAGVKITGFVGACLVLTLLLPRARNAWAAPNRARTLRSGLAFSLPALALYLPWLLKSWAFTGNPIYPFWHERLGGPDWSPVLSQQFGEWMRSIGMGRTLEDFLLLPIRVILEGGPGYHRFDGALGSFWIVALPIAFWGAFGHPLVRRCLWVCALSFVFWALSSQQMRFLIPVLPLLAMASAQSARGLLERLPALKSRGAAIAAIAAAAVALVAVWPHYGFAGRVASRLSGMNDGTRAAYTTHPVYARMNRTLPKTAKVLMLKTNKGFHLDRPYIADSMFEASQIYDWLGASTNQKGVLDRLRARGVTHVLEGSERYAKPYPSTLAAFMKNTEFVFPIHRSFDGRFVLYELRRPNSQ